MKKVVSGLLLLVTVFVAQSCMKDVSVVEPPKPVDGFLALQVPQDFDWATFKTITCNVNTNEATSVEVYTDEACEEELLASLVTSAGNNKLTVSVAQSVDKLYLKYLATSGAYKTLMAALNNDVAVFDVIDGAQQQTAQTKAVQDETVEDHKAYITYPSGWGTVMFEDLFPSTGDYDFNDFVASYQISAEFPQRQVAGKWGYDTDHVNMVRIHLRLKAAGGALRFTPYVRITGLNRSLVSLPNPPYNNSAYVNPKITNNTIDGVQVTLVDSKLTSDAIVEFKNLNGSNPYAPKGASFYNTTPGKTTTDKQLTGVFVYLALSKYVDVESVLDNHIDIFLASEDKTKEIHLRGFKPVFSEYDYTAKGVNKRVTYTTENNLVWGLKVAKKVKHVAEKINFCTAYPDFASWAESGGVQDKNWDKTHVVEGVLIKLEN